MFAQVDHFMFSFTINLHVHVKQHPGQGRKFNLLKSLNISLCSVHLGGNLLTVDGTSPFTWVLRPACAASANT